MLRFGLGAQFAQGARDVKRLRLTGAHFYASAASTRSQM
jgi:hypothetical protein